MKNSVCYQAYFGFGYYFYFGNRVLCCLKTEANV